MSATAHKRVWHDVTNADHSRVLIHFADGVEAEFTHSDLAAAAKPKFYVLGTEGGLIGDWREEKVVARSPHRHAARGPARRLRQPRRPARLHPERRRPHPRDPARRAARAAAAVPPRARRPAAVGRADVGHAGGLAAQHRRHAGRDAVGAPTAAGRCRCPTVRDRPLGVPRRRGDRRARRSRPAVHAADGAVLQAVGRPRRRPRRRARARARRTASYEEVLADPDGRRRLRRAVATRRTCRGRSRRSRPASTSCARSRWG